jgi:hypothetical protein
MLAPAYAAVAECIAVPGPSDPAVCEAAGGPGTMSVDAFDQTQGNLPVDSFLSFDVGVLPGQPYELALELTVADLGADPGADSTGELWQVGSFDYQSLCTTGAPPNIGQGPVGLDQGSVAAYDVVLWPLPQPDLVLVEGVLFFAVRSRSENGVLYWADQGTAPPRLLFLCPQARAD